MTFEIVVDGTDSGGKTPCVEALCRALSADGTKVVSSFATFRVEEVYPLWKTNPYEAASIIRKIMDGVREAHEDHDYLIWDRGWPTAWVSTTNRFARTLLDFPDLTILLLNTVETTKEKVAKYQLEHHEWSKDGTTIESYNREYHRLAADFRDDNVKVFYPTSGRFDFDVIVNEVLTFVKG